MIEGPEGDDRYRMVEDELLSVARRFTAHLHAAEYQRLQEAAKSQNARAIKDISRPVVGSMTDLAKRRQERKAHALNRWRARREARGSGDDTASESDDDDEGYRATSLYGLMESPRKKARRLDAPVITTTKTRAAAGFEETSQRKSSTSEVASQTTFDRPPGSRPRQIVAGVQDPADETTDDDDDLDGPEPTSIAKKLAQQSAPPRQQLPPVRPSQGAAKNQNSGASGKSRLGETVDPPPGKADPTPDDSSDATNGDYFSRLKNRRASLKSSRERRKTGTGNAAPNQDVIPGFFQNAL